VNALVADTKEEWLGAIFEIRDNETLRASLAASGYDTALKRLHPANYVGKLFTALRQVDLLSPWPVDTFLQIIIPHYSPRTDYLLRAIKSALESTGPSREVLVVSSSQIDPRGQLDLFKENVRCIYSKERLSFSEANNLGIRNCDARTTHFLLLNDDTILGKDCLGEMMSVMSKGGDSFLLNPYSNCDKSWLHNDKLWISGSTQVNKDLHPNMTIEEFSEEELGKLQAGFNSDRLDRSGDLIETTFCAFYCTMIPKGVVDRVGFLNTLFKNGGEDLDYCERAKRMGFGSYWVTTAECFHFGGKTRKVAESEDFGKHHEEDRVNNLLVRKRWPKGKKRIGIWTGPAFECWELNSYRTSGIGGSETSAGRLAQIAAEQGHSVYMYGAHERNEQYGVQLVPWNEFIPEEEYFDLFIASRNLNCIDDRLKAKNILVWVHDVWLLSGQYISDYHRQRVTKFICLSPWHVDFFSEYHKVDKSQITIIPNGINVELFGMRNIWEEAISKKVYGKMIFSSSPDRGLANLLYLLPFVKDHVPELNLNIFYGFLNWEAAARSRNNSLELQKIDELKREIEKNKDWVTLHGRINQSDLVKHWNECYLWGYFDTFSETFCCLPKTKISLSDGKYKFIEDITIGENVITHKGNNNVTQIMQRDISEDVYKIKVKALKDPLKITGEHPVLVLNAKEIKCVRTQGYCKHDKKVCTHYEYKDKKDRSIIHTVTKHCSKLGLNFKPTWVPVKDITRGDLLCIPINKNKNKPPRFYDILLENIFDYRQDIDLDHHALSQIYDFIIDEDFLEFCGWYMAEGSFDGKSSIVFSLNLNEIDEAIFIKNLLTKLGLYYKEIKKENEHTNKIVVHSIMLGKFFSSFGRISNDRQIPKWIKDLDIYYLKYFLRGLLHGDGCQIRNTFRVEVASTNLIYDLFEVLLKFDCISFLANSKKKHPIRSKDENGNVKILHSTDKFLPAYMIGCSLTQNKELFEFMGYTVDPKGEKILILKDENYAYLPISKIEKFSYTGTVYNLEVDNDNSYVANNVIVHNCITAKESQLSATPMLTSNVGALQTTVGEYGIRVEGHPYSRESRQTFIDEAVKLFKNKDYWLEWSKKSFEGSKGIDWKSTWDNYWSNWV
jgi:GT2 family glycosyltransferase